MQQSQKIPVILLSLTIAALLVAGYLHYHSMNTAMLQLNAAMRRLDSAQLRVEQSHQIIDSLEINLLSFQSTLDQLRNEVSMLDSHSREKHRVLQNSTQNTARQYDRLAKSFQQKHRTYWPALTIDTSGRH